MEINFCGLPRFVSAKIVLFFDPPKINPREVLVEVFFKQGFGLIRSTFFKKISPSVKTNPREIWQNLHPQTISLKFASYH